MTMTDASKRLKLSRPYLYGVIRGMGIVPLLEPSRGDGKRWRSRRRQLLTDRNLRDIRTRLSSA